MYASTQTLDDVSGDDVTFVLVRQDGTGTRRIDTASSSAEPAFMVIKHEEQGPASAKVDRHLVQFTRTKTDANGVPQTLVANFTLAVPRASVITNAIVYDLVANMVDFLVSGGMVNPMVTTNIEALLRGES